MEDRIIKTGLKTQKDCDIIDGVFGQLSDGMWENSRAAEGYWPYIDAELENGEVVLKVSTAYRSYDHRANKLLDMDDDAVKKWLAKKIKQVIQEEGLDWDRGNDEETDYLDTSWRKSKLPSTVADCYYVYEVLKGRNVAKHPEYANKMKISDALKTLDDAKIKYVQPEDEPWESDLDESAISWPLLSEAVLTPEQREARRKRAKARRELKKREAQPYYVRIYQKSGDLGNGWWHEGKPEPPVYRGYPNLAALKKAFGDAATTTLLRAWPVKMPDFGIEWRAELTEPHLMNTGVLKLIKDDLAKGSQESEHSRYDLD